jgi:hypothetical protein
MFLVLYKSFCYVKLGPVILFILLLVSSGSIQFKFGVVSFGFTGDYIIYIRADSAFSLNVS